jgi:predicted ABC-type ATPase
VETTLAGRSLAVRAERLRRFGYLFRLIFIWSPSADYAIERVAHRVRAGGHDIPEATIRRRYDAGLKNFFRLYQPLADLWDVHENTGIAGFRIIAEGRRDGTIAVADPELWERMKQRG